MAELGLEHKTKEIKTSSLLYYAALLVLNVK